jgi:1-acyl-sn-glycerol-3-phosphate acyltransferase
MSADIVLPHCREKDGRPADRWPVIKTIGYTLDISTRFLASAAVGNGSIARADELIAGYWTRILRSGNCQLSVSGREHFPPGQACVVMSNHCSLLDIPALMGAVPGSVRMVTKEELTKVPIWGQALVASGFIALDRRDRQKAIAQLEKAKRVLSQGVHVWIAPEGTRARENVLGPFKKGGFHVAMDLGVPIIPTWIEGTHGIIPPKSFVVAHDGEIEVRFGAPIPTANLDKDDMEGLMTRVREAMVALSAPASSSPSSTSSSSSAA